MQVKKIVLLGTALLVFASSSWCYDQPPPEGPKPGPGAQRVARNKLTACYKQRTDIMSGYSDQGLQWTKIQPIKFRNAANNHIIDTLQKCYKQCWNVWNVAQSTASITSDQFLAGQSACNYCSNTARGTFNSDATYIPAFPACQGVS